MNKNQMCLKSRSIYVKKLRKYRVRHIKSKKNIKTCSYILIKMAYNDRIRKKISATLYNCNEVTTYGE